MSFTDILNSCLERPSETHQNFDEVASQVPSTPKVRGRAALINAQGQIANRIEAEAGALDEWQLGAWCIDVGPRT